MAGHHSPSAASALREKDRLVGYLVGSGPSGGTHAGTFGTVRDFFIQFRDHGIPWVRIYESTPAWQQQSGGLLIQDWDGDAAAEGAKVFFTLISPKRGGAINRRALGGGTWKSKGAAKVGDEVAVSKLYVKRGGSSGGFTVFEFHLRMALEPQVAICLLHPTKYLHSIRDLRLYIREGWFPGGNQANLGAEQYQDPDVSGFVSGSHVYYTTIPFSNSETIYGQQSIHSSGDAPPPHDASLDAISHLLLSENNSMPEFGGQYSHADEISIQNDYYNILIGNCNMHAITPTQDSMGCFPGGNHGNLHVVQHFPPVHQDHYVAGLTNGPHVDHTTNPVSNSETGYDQPWIHSSASLGEAFDQLLCSENNSIPEPYAQHSQVDEMSAQDYHYNPFGEF